MAKERTTLQIVMVTSNLAEDAASENPPEFPAECCIVIAGPEEQIKAAAKLWGRALEVRSVIPTGDVITGTKDGEALFARCASCSTVYPVLRLPAPMPEVAKAAKCRCPYCGGTKAFLAPHPLESVKGVGSEIPKLSWDNPDGPGAA